MPSFRMFFAAWMSASTMPEAPADKVWRADTARRIDRAAGAAGLRRFRRVDDDDPGAVPRRPVLDHRADQPRRNVQKRAVTSPLQDGPVTGERQRSPLGRRSLETEKNKSDLDCRRAEIDKCRTETGA